MNALVSCYKLYLNRDELKEDFPGFYYHTGRGALPRVVSKLKMNEILTGKFSSEFFQKHYNNASLNIGEEQPCSLNLFRHPEPLPEGEPEFCVGFNVMIYRNDIKALNKHIFKPYEGWYGDYKEIYQWDQDPNWPQVGDAVCKLAVPRLIEEEEDSSDGSRVDANL